ncbi:hypothetical protein BCF33_2536 [Hasllibacter halocynthiae]|uniref:Uncharacterized protein n=1 Tax=Hasllibacter halocynthiae TaxID=595589 RepID=A0A2T0X426_9RHOB|nr:hypothetical protein [Hasllibacter halocynthiae]PRY93655.1 hypothetical protein BCF33_2536 [Hasllibacter halocynthiae]
MTQSLLFDLYLVTGMVVLLLSVPGMVSAWAGGRVPVLPSVMVMVGGGLVIWALAQSATGYAPEDIPRAFANVVAYFLR